MSAVPLTTHAEKRRSSSNQNSVHNGLITSASSIAPVSNSNALSPHPQPQPISAPRLKSNLVFYVSKNVCLQRKEEIDRYLHELFALGPIITTQSRLVAEFFGIWKTDMEIHLRQEDRDPLALHAETNLPTETFAASVVTAPLELIQSEDHQEAQEKETEIALVKDILHEGDEYSVQQQQQQFINVGKEINAPTISSQTLMRKDHNAPPTAPCSPASQSISNVEEQIDNSKPDLVCSTVSSRPTLTIPHLQRADSVNIEMTATTNMTIAQPTSTHLASPALSPIPNTEFPRPPSGWTYELSDKLYKSIGRLDHAATTTTTTTTTELDLDSKMISPIEPTVVENDFGQPLPDTAQVLIIATDTITTTSIETMTTANSTLLTIDSESSIATADTSASTITSDSTSTSTTTTVVDNIITTTTTTATVVGSMDSGTVSDITSRTVKKFKSLRRTNTSSRQPQDEESLNKATNLGSTPTVVATNSVNSSSTRSTTTTTSSVQPNNNNNLSLSVTTPKSKIMKRSKTTVFRPEVTMQPLSSKNVIPPWNRIPSVTGNGPTSPLSPTSPTTPGGTNTLLPLIHSPGSVPGESATATTSTILDPEERPRKLTMSHSKTMSAISSTTASTFSSFWGLGSDNSSSSNSSTAAAAAAVPTNGSNSALKGSAISNNSSLGAFRARSMSISSVSSSASTASTVVAPWNRVGAGSEANTYLHSLQSSSSSSTYVPVELGRSFHKKDGIMQKSYAMGTKGIGIKDRRPSAPSLTYVPPVPESRNRTLSVTTTTPVPRSFENSDISKGLTASRGQGMKRSGMTHSVSAPGGFMPLSSISAPETTTVNVTGVKGIGGNGVGTSPNNNNNLSVAIPSTKKRSPRRESVITPHSPSMPTKQPVSILKNSNSKTNQNRKSSLNVPAGSSMFPIQSVHSLPSLLKSSKSANGSSSSVVSSGTSANHNISIATTFKIVIDADTIVALQILEDKGFVLTLDELKARVKGKLLKSNIQLPERYDLIWAGPSSSSSSSSALNTPISPSTPNLPTSTSSAHRLSDPGVILKADEDLIKAIQSSKNRKVTLRCNLSCFVDKSN